MADHTCPACRVPWPDHAGTETVCRALAEARAEVARLRAQVDDLSSAKSNPEPFEMT